MPCPKLPKCPTPSKHTEKGCIHWFYFGTNKAAKNMDQIHPCIIVGRNNLNSNRVLISPITDIKNYIEGNPKKLKYPYHAALYKRNYKFLDKDSVILLDQIFTVGKTELFEEWYLGTVTNTKEIDEALVYNFDLFESINSTYIDLIKGFQTQYIKNYTRK